jgi:hypothetical protein
VLNFQNGEHEVANKMKNIKNIPSLSELILRKVIFASFFKLRLHM